MTFASFLQDKRAEPILASLAFAFVFLAGFGLFSFTGSIEIAAAVIAVGGLVATLAINLINQARLKASISGDVHENRFRSLETALQMAEIRITAAETTVQSIIQTDITTLKAQLAEIDQIETTPSNANPHSEEPLQNRPNWTHPLRARREEAQIRTLLSEGRLIIEKSDIVSKLSGRTVYLRLEARCDGYGPGDQSEQALRSAQVSTDILRLFDRVRFAHLYNRALQNARTIDTPILVTPLCAETLSNPDDVKGITALLKKTTAISKKIGVILPAQFIIDPSQTYQKILTALRESGLLIGIMLDRQLLSNPGDLMREAPDFILAPARQLAEAESGTLVCAIHPADLLAMFDRRGTDLIAVDIATRREREAVLSLGIHLMSYSNKAALALEPARSPQPAQPSPPPFKLGVELEDDGEGPIPIITQPSTLRERLRRISA